MSLEQQYNSIVHGGNDHYVEVPGLMEAGPNSSVGYGLSQGPLSVFGVRDCCSVLLLGNEGLGATTHYHLDRGSPETYLEEVLQATCNDRQTSVNAAVVGGDPEHITRIKAVLKLLDVPIISQFIDSGSLVCGNPIKHWLDKNIVLLPGNKVAILQVRDYAEVSYKRLSMERWF